MIYLISSERAGQRYDAFTTLLWGFGFATLFWLVVRPCGRSRGSCCRARRATSLLALGVAVIGTLVPFLLMVTALRHLPAAAGRGGGDARARAGVGHRLGLLDQSLAATQITGGVVVLAAITWVQTHRPSA